MINTSHTHTHTQKSLKLRQQRLAVTFFHYVLFYVVKRQPFALETGFLAYKYITFQKKTITHK